MWVVNQPTHNLVTKISFLSLSCFNAPCFVLCCLLTSHRLPSLAKLLHDGPHLLKQIPYNFWWHSWRPKLQVLFKDIGRLNWKAALQCKNPRDFLKDLAEKLCQTSFEGEATPGKGRSSSAEQTQVGSLQEKVSPDLIPHSYFSTRSSNLIWTRCFPKRTH